MEYKHVHLSISETCLPCQALEIYNQLIADYVLIYWTAQSEGFKMFKMFLLVKWITAAATAAACSVSNTEPVAGPEGAAELPVWTQMQMKEYEINFWDTAVPNVHTGRGEINSCFFHFLFFF